MVFSVPLDLLRCVCVCVRLCPDRIFMFQIAKLFKLRDSDSS